MRISYPYGSSVGFVGDGRTGLRGPDRSPEQRRGRQNRSPASQKVWAAQRPLWRSSRQKQTAESDAGRGCDSRAADLMFWGQEGNPGPAYDGRDEEAVREAGGRSPRQGCWKRQVYQSCGIDSFVVCGEKACLALLPSRVHSLMGH